MTPRRQHKQTISRAEYVQLVGLMELARRASERIRDIENAVADVLGMEPEDATAGHPYFGVASDEVWDSDPSAARMLDRLGITVAGGRPDA